MMWTRELWCLLTLSLPPLREENLDMYVQIFVTHPTVRLPRHVSKRIPPSACHIMHCNASRAGHECTRGWPGSVPTGILGAKCHTQIREDSFPRITRSRESKTHGSTGTHRYFPMIDIYGYSQVYPWVPTSRMTVVYGVTLFISKYGKFWWILNHL